MIGFFDVLDVGLFAAWLMIGASLACDLFKDALAKRPVAKLHVFAVAMMIVTAMRLVAP